ncbi:acyltransferase [Vibrio sp. HN007]|uniref:acyltransferase n=1 Tax=Vibrio iocasae TaxID=3098914 RepID=UPI0035D49A5A
MNTLQKLVLSLRNKLRLKGSHSVNIDSTAKLRDCKVSILGNNNSLRVGKNVKLRNVSIEVDGDSCQLIIEDNCVIGESCYLSVREKGTTLTLGKGCMLSRNVKVMTSDGHDILKEGKRINPAKSISIGDKVWLADNVTILKGVAVGAGSVVGINSTLTKSISSQQIAVGNPAKVVASGIEWREELTY